MTITHLDLFFPSRNALWSTDSTSPFFPKLKIEKLTYSIRLLALTFPARPKLAVPTAVSGLLHPPPEHRGTCVVIAAATDSTPGLCVLVHFTGLDIQVVVTMPCHVDWELKPCGPDGWGGGTGAAEEWMGWTTMAMMTEAFLRIEASFLRRKAYRKLRNGRTDSGVAMPLHMLHPYGARSHPLISSTRTQAS